MSILSFFNEVYDEYCNGGDALTHVLLFEMYVLYLSLVICL